MPFDGSGNYTRIHNWTADKNAAIKITSVRHDEEDDGIAAAFNICFLRSGVVPMEGDLQLGTNDITGLGDGAAATPAIRFATDATTGMYLSAAGVLSFSAVGVERARAHALGFTIAGLGAIQTTFEKVLISATGITGAVNVDCKTQAIVSYETNAAGNFTFNLRGDGTTTLNSIMAVNQAMTIAIEVPQGATAYYCTAVTIDGAAPASIKWFGGGAPTAGNVSGIDVYALTVIKTADATFKVRGSLAQAK